MLDKLSCVLAGGERSYTTIAFLLAVGDHTESPFRCMDEFDVFMVSGGHARLSMCGGDTPLTRVSIDSY